MAFRQQLALVPRDCHLQLHVRVQRERASRRRPLLLCALFLMALASACASVERPQYGIRRFELGGTDQMAAAAIESCLVSHEREWVRVTLGIASTACNEPPFDSAAASLRLFRWPWTSWPSFNPAVLDQDVKRIERWYRARGFFDARVVTVRVIPEYALDPGSKLPEGSCRPEAEDCKVDIVVVIQEGKAATVASVRVEGAEALQARFRKTLLHSELLPRASSRFDERAHDEAKQQLAKLLAEGSYASARVFGEIRYEPSARAVHLTYRLEPGKSFKVGRVRVVGNQMVPRAPIIAAADVHAGDPYRESLLAEIQREVHALGAFAVVEVERVLDEATATVDFVVRVTPQKRHSFRTGVGVTSGSLQRTDTGELASVPQWDIHLSSAFERRHVLFGLGKLRLEERPRFIVNHAFPTFTEPRFGNLVKLSLNQMGLVEKRTDLFSSLQWDYGPDPFLSFFRHDMLGRVGLKRAFLDRRLFATLALQQDVYLVERGAKTSDGSETPSSYYYDFVEQDLRFDLRDNAVFPRKGAYFGLYASESVRSPASDWTTFRVAPDVRGYVPLPLAAVFAMRAALAGQYITDSSPELDPASRRLGPNAYRLRGGGASSNRGFLPGQLGAGPDGGVRRWELLSELRIRLGAVFALVGFLDLGDVNAQKRFRFSHLNGSAGWGARVITPIGSIRLDVGYRVLALAGRAAIDHPNRLPLSHRPGAFHLTIGDAF